MTMPTEGQPRRKATTTPCGQALRSTGVPLAPACTAIDADDICGRRDRVGADTVDMGTDMFVLILVGVGVVVFVAVLVMGYLVTARVGRCKRSRPLTLRPQRNPLPLNEPWPPDDAA